MKRIGRRLASSLYPYCRRCSRIMYTIAEITSRRCKVCGRKTRTYWAWS